MSDASPYRFFAVDAATGERIGAPQRFVEETRLRDDFTIPAVTKTGFYHFRSARPHVSPEYCERGWATCRICLADDVLVEVRPKDLGSHLAAHNLTLAQYIRKHAIDLIDILPEWRVAD